MFGEMWFHFFFLQHPVGNYSPTKFQSAHVEINRNAELPPPDPIPITIRYMK